MTPKERIHKAAALKKALHALENKNHDPHTNGEKRVLNILAKRNPQVIFDVGANRGEWSLMAQQACPHAQIHAFEVVPRTYDQLQEAVKPYPDIHPHPFGLSDQTGEITLDFNEDYPTLASGVVGFTGQYHNLSMRPVTGRVKTGVQVCQELGIEQIDFLKMDVEGLEPQVLGGFLPLIDAQKITVLQFEYGHINIETHFLLRDFYQALDSRGYATGKIYPEDVYFKKYDHIDEDFIGPNYLSVLSREKDFIFELANVI